MENVFLLILLVLARLEPDSLPRPLQPVRSERVEPIPAVWSAAYPTLVKAAERKNVWVLADLEAEISPVALYVTNRVVWRNHFESSAGAGETQLQPAEHLSRLAAAVLSLAAPADALSPAVRELVTAYMDLSDLANAVQPPAPERLSSPGLAAFFRLYGQRADEQEWHAFSRAARQMHYRDAIYLLARVPAHFLGHAAGLAESLGPPADFAEAELRGQARELMKLRLRMLAR